MIHTEFHTEDWLYAENKIVLFGGTGGLGERLAQYFSSDYNVGKVGSKDVDVGSPSDVADFLQSSEPDIIINMSGYNHSSFLHKYVDDMDEIEHMIDVNIWGNIHILNEALPLMRKNGYGRIILASSVLSTKTMLGTSIYSASKSFLDTMVRVAAAENASKGITINTIRMGYFAGGLTYKMPEEVQGAVREQIPSKQFGNIVDLYKLIKCIIDTEYINGANIDINGGLNGI